MEEIKKETGAGAKKEKKKKPALSPEIRRRLIAVVLVVAIVLGGVATFLVIHNVVRNRPPELSTIRRRVELLIDASHEVNEIFWGDGLPTYPRVFEHTKRPFYLTRTGNDFSFSAEKTAVFLHYYIFTDENLGEMVAYQFCYYDRTAERYLDVENGTEIASTYAKSYRYVKKTNTDEGGSPLFSLGESYYYAIPDYKEPEIEFPYTAADPENYDYVRTDSKYLDTVSIKERAEAIYAKDFLSSVYESLFTGITVSGDADGTLYARYIDYKDEKGITSLMKSNRQEGFDVDRVYLYDTMRMSEKRKSHASTVYVDIDTHKPGKEEEILTVTVMLVKQNGSWFLGSPTY